MENSNNKETAKSLSTEYKVLAKNTLISVFNSYGTYVLALITSFLLARMITREEWAILILAISLIAILSIMPNFLPPGLIISLNFYIPRYRAKGKEAKLKSFILKALYLRIIAVMLIVLIGLFIIIIFNDFFTIYLQNHINLLYILFPLILISGFEALFITTLIGFNMFKLNLYLLIIKSIINVIPLLAYFLIAKSIEIEIVAYINLFSALAPFILVCFIFFIKVSKLKSNEGDGMSFNRFIKKVISYGSFLRIESLMGDIWKEGQTQSIRIYENPLWVTGYSISRNYTRVSGLFLTALTSPLIYSFSSIDYKKNHEKIVKMFLTIYRYSLYIYLLITGILFFLSDFFLGFIYGEDYIVYSFIIQLLLLGGAISIYPGLYYLLLRTTNRIKQLTILLIIGFPLQIIVFLVGLINFGIIGMLIADIILRAVYLVIFCILSIKVLKINLNILKMIALYFSYFFPIFLTMILSNLFLDEISLQFWSALNLMIFKDLNVLRIFVFVITFLSLNIMFKTFTKADLEYIELLFYKDTISHRYIQKILGLLKRFLR